MGIRPEFRWWILAGGIVAALLGISALALSRPNVVWAQAPDETLRPLCPHCRSEVPRFGTRCPTCREQYDWAVVPDADSPLSPWSLSALEAHVVRERLQALGGAAGERVGAALGIGPEAARRYLAHLGGGRCGWCGGTGEDLGPQAESGGSCPACFGTGQCVACGGDRRMRVGDEGAHRAWVAYEAALVDALSPYLPEDARRQEARRLAQGFLAYHAGSEEATRLRFWRTVGGDGRAGALRVVEACRRRIDEVLRALEVP